ncbi:PEP-CTERM sorting domain-containing protein [Massilia arenosa]|uniref:PEP-CTERM sorting domain-containing protein n=1 Tax=Zemynaea arenosa TaxID=2561931 RepID=A0A4Y9SDP1_9BURK|nr:LamG-like jellyroll fold domain-containing protein [Massilia arenosa]TFW20874.1 PEP-CTERM sorting domain-containing protein [Massilia arenosa]
MKLKTMLAAATMLTALDSHAGLVHQYELNGNLNDTLGGLALTGSGVLDYQHYNLANDQGLHLQYQIGPVYSIDMAFQFDELGSYKRIMNFFDPRSSDYGLYASGNAATGTFRLYPNTHTGGNISLSTPTRLTLTRDAQSIFRMYVNGNLAASIEDAANGYANPGTRLVSFFEDGAKSSESPKGWVDYIRIYDNVLTGNEVYNLPGAVPGNPQVPADLPEPGSVALLLGGLGALGVLRRRRAA